MRIYTLILTVTWAFVAVSQNAPLSLTLENAKELALENQLSIKNAELDQKSAQARVYEIRSMGLPQVSGSANFTHNLIIATQMLPDFITPSVYGVLFQEQLLSPKPLNIATLPAQFGVPYTIFTGLGVNQLLFDGTYFLGLKAANEYKNVSNLLTQKQKIDVKEAVSKAYLMALFTQDQVKQLQESMVQVEKLKNETTILAKNGFSEQLDVDRLELSVMNLQTQINNLEKSAEMAKQMLLFQMGLDINQSIVFEEDFSLYEPENLLYEGISETNNRIEIQILDQQVRLNDMDVKRYQYGYIPTLYANFNYGGNSFAGENQFNQLGNEWFGLSAYGVSLAVPIFDGFYKRSKIQQAKVELEKSLNQKEQILQSINLEYVSAKTELNRTSSNLEFQIKNRTLAEKIYQTTLTKYKNGMASSFELITAESDMIQSKGNYIQALYEFNIALLQLNKTTGNL